VARGRSSARGRGRKRARPGQWFGFQINNIVIDSSAIDNFIIVPPTVAVGTQATATYMGSIINITTGMLPVRGLVQRCSMLLQKTEFSSVSTPANIIDPTSFDAFALANKDVLWWDLLPLPENMGGTLIDDEPMFANYRFVTKSKRKLDMHRHGIVLSMSGFSTADTLVSMVIRSYVKY